MEGMCNVSRRGLVANAMRENRYHYIERRQALRLQ
jgi:hypothetical protein